MLFDIISYSIIHVHSDIYLLCCLHQTTSIPKHVDLNSIVSIDRCILGAYEGAAKKSKAAQRTKR